MCSVLEKVVYILWTLNTTDCQQKKQTLIKHALLQISRLSYFQQITILATIIGFSRRSSKYIFSSVAVSNFFTRTVVLLRNRRGIGFFRVTGSRIHPSTPVFMPCCACVRAHLYVSGQYESSLSSHSREDDCFKLTLHKHVADIYPGARENIVFYRSVCRVIRVTESQMRWPLYFLHRCSYMFARTCVQDSMSFTTRYRDGQKLDDKLRATLKRMTVSKNGGDK